MVTQPQFDFLLDTAADVFGKDEYPPYRNIFLPKPRNAFPNVSDQYFETSALWTRDGLRPRWDNLAVIADQLREPNDDLVSWRSVVDDLQIPLVVLSSHDRYLLLASDQTEPYEATRERLRQELEKQRQRLFSPRSLSKLRSGQPSFADLEETLSADSFAFHLRHRGHLDRALTEGVTKAIEAQIQATPNSPQKSIVESVMVTAVAYLAARILEDKGFFDNQRLLIDDPKELLAKIVGRTDGFFTQAYDKYLPRLDITALQELAAQIGNSVSFTLVDDHDIGRLYEQAIQIIQPYVSTPTPETTAPTFSDLQQHYTPQAVAERMLTLLPLERLRPEERVIFDPAAGSGSLLLAATRRLAAMPDVAMLPDPRNYLAHHVIGNDRDPNAKLITKLRYTLVQETLGQQGLFPDPKYFKEDYREANAWTHSLRPRVIVANPPFAEDDDVQRAARFVKIVLEKLQEGDQFAVVLPQIFLTGSTHGWPEVRQLLSQRCHILEAWQLPEGVIGLSSQESVCVVLGIVEKSSIKGTLARAIVSRARKDIIRDQGFLGQTWIAEIEPDTDDWDSISAPSLESQKPTIPLRNLFYVCSGVTPQKGISPISYQPDGVVVKRYWKNIWRKQGLWANPANIPFNERYIRYGPEYLYRDSSKNEWVYDSEKVLVSRVTNRAAKYPLSVCIDTIGLCPNNNIFCIVPLSPAVSAISSEMKKPEGWERLENKSQLLWLLGVLSSDLAARLSTRGRSARQINSNMIRDFGLPARVDYRIIELTEAIIQGEMSHLPKAKLNMLREELNEVVEVSYGKFNPSITLTRTGPLPDLDKWQQEKKLPSLTVTGQVLDFDAKRNKIQLYLDSLLDEAQEAWVSLPQELPGWALDGTVFEAQLSRTVETLDDLDQRPWALRNFKHTPRPYLTLEELQERLLTKLGQES